MTNEEYLKPFLGYYSPNGNHEQSQYVNLEFEDGLIAIDYCLHGIPGSDKVDPNNLEYITNETILTVIINLNSSKLILTLGKNNLRAQVNEHDSISLIRCSDK